MGLKLVKQILSNPETANHGETLAMKGYLLNCLGKKEEAYEFVRKGLRNDLTSHVCWHVYGLLQRSEHKYDEAIKCYRNALKYDENNITILRDLSLLQIQMRDLEGFCNTRCRLLELRAAQQVSWISLAVAYHLIGYHSTAANLLDRFREVQEEQKKQNSKRDEPDKTHPIAIDYEQSELFLYQVMILQEAGSHKEALDFLNKHSSQICDRLAVLEFKAQLLLALNRNPEAATLIQDQLIARNQENYSYYEQLERALNLNHSDEASRLNLYQTLQQKYPRSQVPFKITLQFVESPERFKPLVDAYLKKYIQKCLPALFRNLRPVYNHEYGKLIHQLPAKDRIIYTSRAYVFEKYTIPSKLKIIEEILLNYLEDLEKNSSAEEKTLLLWVYYYLAQHFDFLGQYEKALDYVRKANDHTPTLIEILTLKGKIYKHMGEIEKAVEQVQEAQRLDTADRYLNSKCAKYLLRANKISQAEDMCSKFTRAGVQVTENLNEMQCIWFQLETARAHHRMKQYGLALKKCYEIDAFFSEVTEDQFDFHTYCMRKMTLRAYVKLLRVEDILRSHEFFFKAAEIAISIYLNLHDEPLEAGKENQCDKKAEKQLSASELKKIKSKERKAAAKQDQTKTRANNHKSNMSEADDSKAKNSSSNSGDTPGADIKSTGFDPDSLVHTQDPLAQAVRFLTPLKTLAVKRIDTHLLAFEIYRRKQKLLLMLQSAKRAHNLDPSDPRLRSQLAQFQDIVTQLKKDGKLTKPITSVLDVELPRLQIAF